MVVKCGLYLAILGIPTSILSFWDPWLENMETNRPGSTTGRLMASPGRLMGTHSINSPNIHAKLCPNRLNGIQMPSRNVIYGVKFGRFWTFDRRPPSWILRKIKNSSVGLFLGSKSDERDPICPTLTLINICARGWRLLMILEYFLILVISLWKWFDFSDEYYWGPQWGIWDIGDIGQKKWEIWGISKYFLGHILSKMDFICPQWSQKSSY